MRVEQFKKLVNEAVQPTHIDVIRAKKEIAAILADGMPHPKADLVKALATAEGLRSASVTVVGSRELDEESFDENHSSILFTRYHLAGEEALGDLVAQGLALASTGSPLSLPYQFVQGSTQQHGAMYIDYSPAQLDSVDFRLPSSLRGTEVRHLEIDLFTSDITDLSLSEPTIRALHEGLAAFRGGLYLSSAAMMGAVVASAWASAGLRMASPNSKLGKAIANDETVQVQRLVRDNLQATPGIGDQASDLFSFAQYARRLRNYGAHPATNDDIPVASHLTEVGCGLLILQTHLHLTELNSAVATWESINSPMRGETDRKNSEA